jgi:L-ascorbate metabolism protein UlaG (beta-lactamase superfamily)
MKWQDLGAVDAVLVTHDHGDHLGQAVEIRAAHDAQLVCIFDLATRLRGDGVPADRLLGMNMGGTVDAAGVRVKMVQAFHSAQTGAPAGYIMTFPAASAPITRATPRSSRT